MSDQQPIKLDKSVIERFLTAFAQMKAAMKRSGRPVVDPDTPPDPKDAADAQAIAGKHGFATAEEWALTMSAIMTAYEYALPDAPIARLDQNMASAKAEILADNALSAAEKQQMIDGLQEEHDTMLRMKPSDAHISAVRPYIARIKALIDIK